MLFDNKFYSQISQPHFDAFFCIFVIESAYTFKRIIGRKVRHKCLFLLIRYWSVFKDGGHILGLAHRPEKSFEKIDFKSVILNFDPLVI